MQFARSFTLPSMIDTGKVEAVLKNGNSGDGVNFFI
jgi:HSP20 family molecular chaperone IbpA